MGILWYTYGRYGAIESSYHDYNVVNQKSRMSCKRPQPRSLFVFNHMINTIVGTKIKQSQEFTSDGRRIPVTYIQAGPCLITDVSNRENYQSLRLAFGTVKHMNKPDTGQYKKAGLETKPRFLRTVRVYGQDAKDEACKVGSIVQAEDIFSAGDSVRVVGTSKGKGFAGVVKRHGFAGGPRTHGQSDRERAPGSIGQTTTPGRVYRGKRMAGRMGGDRVTVRGLKIVRVDASNHTMVVEGLVPGPKGGLLLISKEIK